MRFLNSTQFGRRTGTCRQHGWRLSRRHPGFAIKVGSAVRIPEPHVIRLESGESVASIAATPSIRDDDGGEPHAA
jgi:hypothetical protein